MNYPLTQEVGHAWGAGTKIRRCLPEKSHLESIWVLIGVEQEAGVDLLRAPREKS